MIAPVRVDARGMRCPWPVLRLAKAMRVGGAGAIVHILADDPIAPSEIAALAAERGWRVVPLDGEPSGFEVSAD